MENSRVRITYFSVGMNICLTLLKLLVSFLTGSTAILSEAVHSGSDLFTSFIAMFSVKESEKPPDRDHPYGHGKFENIASLMQAVIIFSSGVFIFHKSMQQIIMGVHIEEVDMGIGVMLISFTANFFISSFLIKKGKELNSPAIEADGWHSRTDVYTSMGIMISLAAVKYTGFTLLDPIIAMGVGSVIFWIAVKIFMDSFVVLVDKRLPPIEENLIKNVIKNHSHSYLDFHRMRTRKTGGNREVDLHLVFPDRTLLKDAHSLASSIEKEIKDLYPGIKVLIHLEPCESGNNVEIECEKCAANKQCEEKKETKN